MLTTFDYERRFFKTLGLASQEDDFRRHVSAPANWQNHDISVLDMAIRMPGELVDVMLHEALNYWSYANRLSPYQRSVFIDHLMREVFDNQGPDYSGLPEPPSSDYIDDVLDHYKDLTDDVELAQREKVALDAVEATLTEDPHTSLTLLWGLQHLPALGRGIEALGYEQRDEWY